MSAHTPRPWPWCTAVVGALAAVLLAGPAVAWQSGAVDPGWSLGPRFAGPPTVALPAASLRPGYRFSLPAGIPLSLDDPENGLTYCLSPSMGVYYVCGYVRAVELPVPVVPALTTGSMDRAVLPPATALVLFRLAAGGEASIDNVPIRLTDGLGVASVAPGRHRVVVRVSGVDTEHVVELPSHRVVIVTPAGIVATEP